MRIIPPIALNDAALISSNIIEELPRGTSAATYNLWVATTSYSAATQVCWQFTSQYGFSFTTAAGIRHYEYYVPPAPSTGANYFPPGTYFGLFTAIYANINAEPSKTAYTAGDTTQPGYRHWAMNDVVPAYDAGTAFALQQVIGYVNGATGAFYQSLAAANTGNTPSSSPTFWRQTTADSYATWGSGTTYGNGDISTIIAGQIGSVYQSLQAANTNHNPATSPTWWTYLGQAYKQWAAATAYVTGDTVGILSQHHNYEALQAGTGKDPTDPANSAYWLDLGANARWAMFDGSTSSLSSYGGEIDVTLQPGGSFDSVALLGLTAQSVRVVLNDPAKTLYLNFTATETLDSRITASGGANGTRVNSSGLIAAATTPRFDYDPVTLEPLGLLIEEARTNYLLRSQELGTSPWAIETNASIVANAATAPDGTMTADRLVAVAGGVGAYNTETTSIATSTAYTLSIYAKAGSLSLFRMLLANQNESAWAGYDFDLVAKTTTATGIIGFTSPSASIVDAGNGWFRCIISATTPPSGLTGLSCFPRLQSVGDIYLWGAHLELGAAATSHIPTAGSTVTRTADALSITGANFSSWYNPTEGTFVVEFDHGTYGGGSEGVFGTSDGTSDNSLSVYTQGANVRAEQLLASVVNANFTIAYNASPKVAVAYKLNDINTAVDGVASTADTSCVLPTVDRLYIGAIYSGIVHLNGHIIILKYYNERKPDTFLQSETASLSDYDVSIDLNDSSFITDYRHYCFDAITYQSDVVLNDIPVIAGATIDITISNPGGTANCGMVSIGLSETMGGTVYGATTGIMDFSRKEFNDFGDTIIVPRPYSKRGSFRSVVYNTQIAAIQSRLAQLRATPVVYQGTDAYANTWILGFYRDFGISMEHMEQSYLNIEVEGLT